MDSDIQTHLLIHVHSTHWLSFRYTCLHNLLSGFRLINQIQVVSNFDNITGSFYKPAVELTVIIDLGQAFLMGDFHH